MTSCHHVMATKTDGEGKEVPAYCCAKCGIPMRIQWAETGDLNHHLRSSGPGWIEATFGGRWVWLTDANLHEATQWHAVGAKPIAWLLEPSELHPENYAYVFEHRGDFEAIVTHDRELYDELRRAHYERRLFGYLGGTRIHPSDWGIPEKSRAVSIVASPKRSMEGHRLRHELIDAIRASGKLGARPRDEWLHVYGYDGYLARKRDALLPYRFNVAIENCRRDYWFTEALLDCFLTGTVPIYWGCPSIGEFFNTDGIIECEALEELCDWVGNVVQAPNGYYNARADAIRDNFIRAHEYTMTEDWLFRQYPELFE